MSGVAIVVVIVGCVIPTILGQEPCPTWYTYNYSEGRCTCRQGKNGHGADGTFCTDPGKVFARIDFCMTFDNKTNQTIAGACHRGSYEKQKFQGAFKLMPNDTELLELAQCEPNKREGLLCSKCAPGYGVPATSLITKCIECKSNTTLPTVLLYLVIELLPITVFFIVIVISHTNILSGPLFGYFIFCQSYTTLSNHLFELHSYLKYISNPATRLFLNASYTLSSIWALGAFNILPSVCVGRELGFLDALTLKFIRVLYPLFLVPLTFLLINLHARGVKPIVLMWKPFGECLRRLNQNINTSDSIIHAYATLYFMSFGSLIYLSFKLLSLTPLLNEYAHPFRKRVLADPTIVGYSREHAVYITAAYGMLIPLGLIPTLLITFYPFGRFRNALERRLSYRKRIMLGIFFDTLHGNFKNGLDGTRDYRSSLGIIMFLTICLALTNAHITGHYSLTTILFSACSLMTIALTVAYVRPLKTLLGNLSVSLHAALSSTMCVLVAGWLLPEQAFRNDTMSAMFTCLVFSPHLLMLLWLVYKITQTNRMRYLVSRIRSCRVRTQGYTEIN